MTEETSFESSKPHPTSTTAQYPEGEQPQATRPEEQQTQQQPEQHPPSQPSFSFPAAAPPLYESYASRPIFVLPVPIMPGALGGSHPKAKGRPPPGFGTAAPFGVNPLADYGAVQPGLWDSEAGMWMPVYSSQFLESAARKAFVQKVLGIVLVQLLITVGISAMFFFWTGLKVAVMSNPWVFLAVWLVSFVLMMVLAYNAEARRIYPYNYVTLVLFTLSFAFLVGIITSMFNVYLLLMAVAFTAATVGFILILATVSDFDFTRTAGLLYVVGFVFMVAILVGVFVPSNIYYIIISAIAAVLFSAYLLFDLQAIMGGRMLEMLPDDYIYAAVQVYLDVVTIFLALLNLLALSNQQ